MKRKTLALGLCLIAAACAATAQTSASKNGRKNYIVELWDAPAAVYSGGVNNLKPTRPVAGGKLNTTAADVQAYLNYLKTKSVAVQATVPSAQVYHRYGLVFNGFAAKLNDDELIKLASNPGVRAITSDRIRKVNTSYTPAYLGLRGTAGGWNLRDSAGRVIKGEDVIIAHIDTGVWPEDPSFSDKVGADGKPIASHLPGTVVYNPLPAGRYKGGCQIGPGILATHCNNKLIGAQVFNSSWIASEATPADQEFLYSARDGAGHGSHTLSTSGGNENVDLDVQGTSIKGASGIAPRARLAMYKTCFEGYYAGETGCAPGDSVQAIEKAVADGVDVINYSISGTRTDYRDAVEVAFYHAAAAGVFVAASAGNDGPLNTVAHPSPWLTTVANTTHDRFTVAKMTMGNGATASGPSFQQAGLSSKPLILATEAGMAPFDQLAADDKIALARCYSLYDRYGGGGSDLAALDPAKVAGKIVVCFRGGNVLVNKAQTAKDAGAAGMVLQNLPAGLVPGFEATEDNTFNQTYAVPSVHLASSYAASVLAYARTPGASASFGPGIQTAGVVAPQMADSSSRGPNLADVNQLKPDIAAPGSDILAAFINTSLTAEQHDMVAAGTFIPGPGAESLTGTSMAAPHVAGAAALIKQAHPTWSPFAIKSALMTSAAQIVKLADGSPDNSRWGYGAGQLQPTAALGTSLVYDTTMADYAGYLAGTVSSSNLNLPSITSISILGPTSFIRTVTNRGNSAATFSVVPNVPGFTATATPASMSLAPGASGSFTLTLTRTTADLNAWALGDVSLVGAGTTVRSPVTVKPSAFAVASQVTDTRALGSQIYTLGAGYTGNLNTTPVGMVPATRWSGQVARGAQTCFDITVPAGARRVRAQLFNADTQGGTASDLDLTLSRNGTLVGTSSMTGSDEMLMVDTPAAGTYKACVLGIDPANGAASFTLSTWVVGPATGTQTLRAFGAAKVGINETASIGASWNVPAGQRYLGAIDFRAQAGGAILGSTTVFVNTVPATVGVSAAVAPVLRDKPLR